MRKKTFYTEAAYFAGLLLLALGTALTERGGLGISMVVAPAYILHLYVSQFLPFFSFGLAECVLQALVMLLMVLVLRKTRAGHFLCIATAVIYSLLLDGAMLLIQFLPLDGIFAYAVGVVLCAGGIALLFQTYLPPAAYELLVKRLAARLRIPVSKVKLVYDCCSLVVSIGMSLALFGSLRGIGIGTVLCAFLYGPLIQSFGKLFDRFFHFTDRFPLRTYFHERE